MDDQRFFAVPGFANAAFAIAAVLLVIAAAIPALDHEHAISFIVSIVFVIISALTAGIANFTKRTPVIVIGGRELVVRAAMLAPEVRMPVASLRGFDVVDGYLRIVPKQGEPTRVPASSFTREDFAALEAALECRVKRLDGQS